jgi:hypothetical protein
MVVDEDEALWNAIKHCPDVDCLPLPIRFFHKFGIAPRGVENTKEYLSSQYTIKKQFEPKDLPPLVIDEPIKDKDGNVKLVEVHPSEDIQVETISRPFEQEEGKTTVVLPSLKDDSDIVKKYEVELSTKEAA